MSTNDEKEESNDSDAVADLQAAKTESEGAKPEDQVSEPETQSEGTPEVKDPAETVSATTFTKNVPSIPGETPEEYQANLEKAYQESTKEALRLKDLVKPEVTEAQPQVPLTPADLYIKQKQTEESDAAYAELKTKYSQASDPEEYKKFTHEAEILGRTILEAEKRLVGPKELYGKTAILLGWQDDSSERLGSAVKDGASSPRVSSGTSVPQASKVTDAMIIANRKMYPGKSDAQIREELEDYVQ